jgi:hypothetical protein
VFFSELIRINDQNRNRGFLDHIFCHTSKDRVLKAFITVRPHDHEIDGMDFDRFEDFLGRGP